jgi:hypothetical protein
MGKWSGSPPIGAARGERRVEIGGPAARMPVLRVRPKMTHHACTRRLREIDERLRCDSIVVKMGRTRKTGIRTAYRFKP